MVETSFVAVVVVLVAAAVLVLILQGRKGRAEGAGAPVVSRRTRSLVVAFYAAWFAVGAVGAAMDGRKVGAVVGGLGAAAAVAHVAYIYRDRFTSR